MQTQTHESREEEGEVMLEPWYSGNFNHSETVDRSQTTAHTCFAFHAHPFLLTLFVGSCWLGAVSEAAYVEPRQILSSLHMKKTGGTQPDSDRVISVA